MLNTLGSVSRQNVELIQRSYEAFNERDLDPVLAMMHPDFELDFSGSLGPERGVYSGADGMRKLFESYWDAFERISIEPESFIGQGDVIIAMVRAQGRGQGSGAEVDARGPHVWSFRDGMVIGFALHQDLDEALQATGLSE